MRKVFIGKLYTRSDSYGYYDYDLNISEERYFEVDEETFDRLQWFCSRSKDFRLFEWVEPQTPAYTNILELAQKEWDKEQARIAKAKEKDAAAAKTKAERERVRKLKQLEKLQKELGIE